MALGAIGLLGFVRSRADSPTGDGPCLFWATRTLHFVVNQRGSLHLTGEAQFAAVAAGFAAWATPACTDVRLVDDGVTARNDVGYDAGTGTVAGLVVWRPVLCGSVVPASDPCLAEASCDDAYDCLDDGLDIAASVTSYFYRFDTGQLFGAGTELNDPNFVFSTVDSPPCDPSRPPACDADGGEADAAGCASFGPPMPAPDAVNPTCVDYDVENTMAHEAGHYLGFAHTQVAGATMNAAFAPGDLGKRTLHPDDLSAVCTVYPAGQPTETACQGPADAGIAQGCCGCSNGGPGAAAGLLLLLGFAAFARAGRRARSVGP